MFDVERCMEVGNFTFEFNCTVRKFGLSIFGSLAHQGREICGRLACSLGLLIRLPCTEVNNLEQKIEY